MHPRPTENETHTLTLDLNRGMTDGMKRGRQRSPGRHWEKWRHENQWEKEDEPESA